MYPSGQVQVFRNMDNLHGIANQSVSAIYSRYVEE